MVPKEQSNIYKDLNEGRWFCLFFFKFFLWKQHDDVDMNNYCVFCFSCLILDM